MTEWSEALSVEALVVTGSDPTLARKYLFAVYSSLYDHSVLLRQVGIKEMLHLSLISTDAKSTRDIPRPFFNMSKGLQKK